MLRISTLILSLIICLIPLSAYSADATSDAGGGTSTGGSSGNALLQQIANNTYQTLAAVNNIPTYLNEITQMAISWLTLEDDPANSFIIQNQGDFASLGNLFTQINTAQDQLQEQVTADVLGTEPDKLINPKNKPKILDTLSYANELVFPTILGKPPIKKGDASAYNYLKNATGLTMTHLAPNDSWQGSMANKQKYRGYYNTITAATSFDAYTLSNLVAEQKTGQLTPIQNTLITKASESSWLAQISTEELGKVLRDILLFESQNYVLATKMLQIQQQLLTAQVITNSLIIATNYTSESNMLSDALGIPAS